MLFPLGERPTHAAILEFAWRHHAVSPSHDIASEAATKIVVARGDHALASQREVDAQHEVWLELRREGLTFDLRGLADGPSRPVPVIVHRFDFSAAAAAGGLEALSIVPGPHLEGGEHSMPVLKGMLALARDLTQHFEQLQAIFWQPSQSAIGRRYFESVITAWLEGGAFPALGLTAFNEMPDGALQSVGLRFWIGQELRIEPPLTADKVAATRLGVRLINHLVIVGGQDDSERIIAPDGTRLVMRPSRNREFIRVLRE